MSVHMRTTLIVFILACFSLSCKTEIEKLPSCIQDLVHQAEEGIDEYDASQILEYEYKNKKYYYIVPRGFHQLVPLLDKNCNVVCHPAGGYWGVGDGECPDWVSSLTDGVIIWERE